jgi:Tubulin-tyrosine ligase family
MCALLSPYTTGAATSSNSSSTPANSSTTANSSSSSTSGWSHADDFASADVPIEGSRCIEVLGFDFMIDEALKPWLIEVNHLPSFGTDSPLDMNIKVCYLLDSYF